MSLICWMRSNLLFVANPVNEKYLKNLYNISNLLCFKIPVAIIEFTLKNTSKVLYSGVAMLLLPDIENMTFGLADVLELYLCQ